MLFERVSPHHMNAGNIHLNQGSIVMSMRLTERAASGASTPVPQVYTHKANPAEVLLSRWSRTGVDSYDITARWPQQHSFYLNRFGLHDPLLLSETVRQTLPLLAHGAYHVPFGHQLLWRDFAWDLDPQGLSHQGKPADVDLHITCTDVRYRKDRASAIELVAEVERDGAALATARSSFTIQERAVYERLRGRYADISAIRTLPLSIPASPQAVGRYSFEDVVLSPTDQSDRWQLRVDDAHPILFDHPVDHAPGMLLLEAARQAAQARVHPQRAVVVGMRSVFTRYAELDAACWVHATPLAANPAGRERVEIAIEQHGSIIFSSDVTVGAVTGS